MNEERIDRRLGVEDFMLRNMMVRLLAELRRQGMTVVRDEDADWRAVLAGANLTLYQREIDFVETILACNCPCPSECGMLVVRMCTLKLEEEIA
jgi:hypothetical protein